MKLFSRLDHEMIAWMLRDLEEEQRTRLYPLLLVLIASLKQGHLCLGLSQTRSECLRLKEFADPRVQNEYHAELDPRDLEALDQLISLSNADSKLEQLQTLLRAHPALLSSAFDEVELEPAQEPSASWIRSEHQLVLIHLESDAFLYTKSSYLAEQELRREFALRLARLEATPNTGLAAKLGSHLSLSQEQQKALEASINQRVFILSGGPGTGKTRSACALLALFCADFQARHGRIPELRLLAPTGRAAQRLSSQIQTLSAKLSEPDYPAQLAQHLSSLEAKTLHSYLGQNWRHHSFEKIIRSLISAPDLILIDEASMVDINMLLQLLRRTPPTCQLVLLGDPHQLPAIEGGAVLADLIQVLNASFDKALEFGAVLKQDHRMVQEISRLAQQVQSGISPTPDVPPSSWPQARSSTEQHCSVQVQADPLLLRNQVIDQYLRKIHPKQLRSLSSEELYQNMCSQVILSPQHSGLCGIRNINKTLSKLYFGTSDYAGSTYKLHGMPIVVTVNTYELGVFNGDMAVIVNEQGQSFAFFGSKRIALEEIRAWEPAFAMSIHKSQGSEFETVILCLGEESTKLCSRELLYTGITRAKNQLYLFAHPEALDEACRRSVQRSSLLAQWLVKDASKRLPVKNG